MRRRAGAVGLIAVAVGLAAWPAGPVSADQAPTCQPGVTGPVGGAGPSVAGGVNLVLARSHQTVWCSAATIEANQDIPNGTNVPIDDPGNRNPVSNAISLHHLLTLAGIDPAGVGFVTVPRLDGSLIYLHPGDLSDPSPSFTADLLPLVDINGTETDFLRPQRTPGDQNGRDQVFVQNGQALGVTVHTGRLLTVTISADPSRAARGRAVDFTAHVSGGPAGALRYAWNFGDGSKPAQAAAPRHVYTATGVYPVTLLVGGSNDSGGAAAPFSIVVGTPPAATGGGHNTRGPAVRTVARPRGPATQPRSDSAGGTRAPRRLPAGQPRPGPLRRPHPARPSTTSSSSTTSSRRRPAPPAHPSRRPPVGPACAGQTRPAAPSPPTDHRTPDRLRHTRRAGATGGPAQNVGGLCPVGPSARVHQRTRHRAGGMRHHGPARRRCRLRSSVPAAGAADHGLLALRVGRPPAMLALAISTHGIDNAIFRVADVLEVPVLVAALLALAGVIYELGSFAVEVRSRRRRGVDLEQAAVSSRQALRADDPEGAEQALTPVARSAAMAGTLRIVVSHALKPGGDHRLNKALADFDFETQRRLARTRVLVRAGPALGLMGTLIPLSPALTGLAQGNVSRLSENLRVAFSVTVLGLLIGAVAFGLSLYRDRMYGQDLSDLRVRGRGGEHPREDSA